MARARTHDGRNSWSSEMTVDTVAVQANPQITSTGTPPTRSAPPPAPRRRRRTPTAASPTIRVGRQVLLDPAQAQGGDHRARAERGEQQPVAVRRKPSCRLAISGSSAHTAHAGTMNVDEPDQQRRTTGSLRT